MSDQDKSSCTLNGEKHDFYQDRSTQFVEIPRAGTDGSSPRAARDIDRGHAWLVLAGSAGSHVAFGFLVHGFSVLYGDIVEHFQASWASVGWVGSLCGASFGLLALCQGYLVDRIGCRYACMLGALLSCSGLALSSLLVSVPYLWLTYGFITGTSCGLYYLASVAIVQRSFHSKRPLANGIRTCFTNIGGLVCGPLMRYFIDEYGLRGALLLEAGVLLQPFALGACFTEPSPKQLTDDDDKTHSEPAAGSSGGQISQSVAKDKSKHLCCYLGCFKDMKDICNNTRFVLYIVASFVQCSGITTFYHHIVNYALFAGFSKSQSALLPFALNIGIGIGALLFGFLANLPGYDGVLQVACVVFIKGVIVMSTVAVTRFYVLLVLVAFSGFLGGSIFAVEVTNMTTMVSLDQIVTAQAILMTTFGASTLISVSFAGLLVDVTGTYALPMLLSGSVQTLSSVFYLTVSCINRRCKTVPGSVEPKDTVTKL